jgi:hypothetical protein
LVKEIRALALNVELELNMEKELTEHFENTEI